MLIFTELLKPFRAKSIVARAREQLEEDKREIYRLDFHLEEMAFRRALFEQRVVRLQKLIAADGQTVVRLAQHP